ncbi:MAG: hypothetical protein Q4P28_06630, partial [Tissierellia bacterium]|nr:hypothetical protein [Tissierellia bacterium]
MMEFKKHMKYQVALLMIVTMIISMAISSRASGDYTLIVQHGPEQEGDLAYDLWKVDDSIHWTEDEIKEQLLSLQKMNRESLKDKYGEALQGEIKDGDQLVFKPMEKGLYYGRQK